MDRPRKLLLGLVVAAAIPLGAATVSQAAHGATNRAAVGQSQLPVPQHPNAPVAPIALTPAPALQHEPPVDLTPAAQVMPARYATANPSDAAVLAAGTAHPSTPSATPLVGTATP